MGCCKNKKKTGHKQGKPELYVLVDSLSFPDLGCRDFACSFIYHA